MPTSSTPYPTSASIAADGPSLRLAVAAFLTNYKGQTRVHAESDLSCYLAWCEAVRLDVFAARRVDLERYLRWMQTSRRLQALYGLQTHSPWSLASTAPASSTASSDTRRPSTCAAPGCLTESPTLGLSHLQFEALLTAARDSSNPNDAALVSMLGLLGLRICEATGADIENLSEVHGHRVLKVHGKGGKVVLTPLPPAVARAIERATAERSWGPILRSRAETRMSRHVATRRLQRLTFAAGITISRMHPHMLRHTFVTTMLDAGVDLRDVQIAARHADPRTTMRYDRARKNLDRHPNYILAAFMASST